MKINVTKVIVDCLGYSEINLVYRTISDALVCVNCNLDSIKSEGSPVLLMAYLIDNIIMTWKGVKLKS